MSERVCVVGASGFLGHWLCAALKARGVWVRGVGRQRCRPAALQVDEYRCADVRWPWTAAYALETCEQVYDLAATQRNLVEPRTIRDSALLAENLRVNLAVLEAAAERGARYLFTSSDSVYSAWMGGEHGVPPTEDLAYPAWPENTYGWAKLVHERACLAFRDRGIETRIARIQGPYGPYCATTGPRVRLMALLCAKVHQAIADGSHIVELTGSGQQRRAFCHARDIADGLIRLMESDVTIPVNLGSDDAVPIAAWVGRIAQAAGHPVALQTVAGGEGSPLRWVSTRRAQRLLGWQPTITWEQGLAQTYEWVAAQRAAGVAA